MSISFIQEIASVFADVQTELVCFAIAIATHFLFFHKLRPSTPSRKDRTKKQQINQEGSGILPLKAALRAGDLKTAMSQFEELQGLWQKQESPSSAPRMLMEQIIKLAVEKGALADFLRLLAKMKLLSDTLDIVLAYCAEQGDSANLKAVEQFGVLHGVKMSSSAYQALIRAASSCGTQEDAQRLISQARAAGVADGATYNAYMTALLKWGSTQEVCKVMDNMRSDGVQPNHVAFNKLLGAAVSSDVASMWSIIDMMNDFNVKPDSVTCAILLKSRFVNSKGANIEKVLAVINNLDGEMDEVLSNSVVDACVRVGRPDLLMPFLKHRSSKRLIVKGAHTYGSIIRAYGSNNDIRGAWNTWEEMKKQHVAPISVTVGAMVEALATNGDIEGGYELIQEIQQDEKTASLVNAVMYGSIVKGFSHKKCFTRMWEVYDEMVARKLQFSMVTFNTLIDACARSGELNRVPPLLNDIEAQGLKMGIQTYGAILKGYCQKNMLDEATELFDSMSRDAGLVPDEIMFNTLLDGCARQGLYERGMKLLGKMEASGVRPTNFTLSVLVKMANRGRKVNKAFELCEELSAKYSFRLNVHVFSNLVHACVQHNDLPRGIAVLERMLQERVRPDMRTYSLLLKACIETRKGKDADGILRAAMGLSDPHLQLANFSKAAMQPLGGLPADLISEVLQGLLDVCREESLCAALFLQLSRVSGLKLDPKLRLRLAARMA